MYAIQRNANALETASAVGYMDDRKNDGNNAAPKTTEQYFLERMIDNDTQITEKSSVKKLLSRKCPIPNMLGR